MSLQFAWMDVCVLPSGFLLMDMKKQYKFLKSYTRHELVPKKSCYSATLKDFDYKTKKQIWLSNFFDLFGKCLYVIEVMLMSLKTVTGKMGGEASHPETNSINKCHKQSSLKTHPLVAIVFHWKKSRFFRNPETSQCKSYYYLTTSFYKPKNRWLARISEPSTVLVSFLGLHFRWFCPLLEDDPWDVAASAACH